MRNADEPMRVNLGAEDTAAEQAAKVLGEAYGVTLDAGPGEHGPERHCSGCLTGRVA